MALTNTEVLHLLELYREHDYSRVRPHFYVRSLKADTWIRPKGLRILASSQEVAMLHWEPEEWEAIPYQDLDFGLW